MKYQLPAALGILVSVYVSGEQGFYRTAASAAQGPSTSAAAKGAVPRTPWGHPDLQGVWSTDLEIGVPVERPVELGEKAELTEAEFRQRTDALKKRYLEDEKANRVGEVGNEQGPVHWYEGGRQVSRRTSLVIDPPNGRLPPYTTEAQKRIVPRGTELGFVGGSMGKGPFDGPEDLHLADRCITRGLPQTWFPSEYNNGFQIVQTPGLIVVYYERLHEARVIPIDGRPHLDSRMRQWFGDSRGRWEGNTLVVDVTNFSDRTTFRRSGSTLHLIERYTRIDPETVRVEVTIDDPTTWTKPWTFAVTGKKDPSYWQIFEYACHEGNYAMFNILSGARAEERAAARTR
jgi:hypothetical protein